MNATVEALEAEVRTNQIVVRLISERDAARANHLKVMKERDDLWLEVQELRQLRAELRELREMNLRRALAAHSGHRTLAARLKASTYSLAARLRGEG